MNATRREILDNLERDILGIQGVLAYQSPENVNPGLVAAYASLVQSYTSLLKLLAQ